MNATLEEVQAALSNHFSAADILHKGLIAPKEEVGRRFEEGEFFVPEMLVVARAMQAGLEILRSLLADSGVGPVGKVVMGTVKGDLHDIGKNLVSMRIEEAGFEIIDLGTDVAPEKFVVAIQDDVDIVGFQLC